MSPAFSQHSCFRAVFIAAYALSVFFYHALCCAKSAVGQQAQSEGAEVQQLEEIQLKVREHSVELEAVRNHQAQLDMEMKEIRGSIEHVQKEKRNVEEELRSNEARQEQLSTRLAEIEKQQEHVRELSRRRIRALYVSRQSGTFDRVLFSGDTPYFGRQVIFLRSIQDFDRELLESLHALSQQKTAQQAELEEVLTQQRALQQKLENKRKSLAERLADQNRVGADLKKQRTRIETVLAELRAQALRIETVVSSITTVPERPQKISNGTSSFVSSAPLDSFPGAGLKAKDAALIVPIAAKVVSQFGQKRGKNFEDLVRSKGVEFLGAEGEEIRAVAAGKVIFSGFMPGFSNIVIVDHGKRTYSLYGRLADVQVQRGQTVESAQSLGRIGPSDERGSNFYFEIREQGRSVDPKRYFPQL